jgi:hypothetical protein
MKYFILVFTVLLFSCIDRDRKEASATYFDKEIASRMKAITDLKLSDSIVDVVEVNEEVDRLVLMSKDVENLQAAINLSKKFFDELAEKNRINRSDFIDLNDEMSLEETATALKGNELNFFNQILFRYKGSTGMYTAQ